MGEKNRTFQKRLLKSFKQDGQDGEGYDKS